MTPPTVEEALAATQPTSGKLTPAEIERRHLVAGIAGVARWLLDDPGYTRKMAARDLANIARKENRGVWSDGEMALLLGAAAHEVSA